MPAFLFLNIAGSPLHSQSEERDPSIENLPRRGYEPRKITLGATVLEPRLDVKLAYDDNIYAVQVEKTGDALVDVSPGISAHHGGANVDIDLDGHADLIRYASHSRENVNAFDVNLKTAIRHDKQSILVRAGFNRTFERRSDPEASTDRSRPPALINLASADLQYSYRDPQWGVQARLAVADLNYLPAADADRDLSTYRLSLRGLLNISPRVAFLAEPFVNRRDARLKVDRSGLDRDTTTAGGLAGLAFNLTGKLDGNIGFGMFSANPDDDRLRSFTGLAANGRLVWRPRTRTAVIVDFFRGDVATNRLGALGRIDSSVSLAVDQEVRHNLILHGLVANRHVHYRGIDRDQNYLTIEGEARYLLNRYLSVVFDAAHMRRTATQPDERFQRWRTTLGLRLAY